MLPRVRRGNRDSLPPTVPQGTDDVLVIPRNFPRYRRPACCIPGMLDTTPALLSTVRLRKQGEEYLVVDVDLGTETLELRSMAENRKLIQGVQLSAIHELVEGPPIYL